MIRSVNIKDAAALAEIYNYYILNSIATFEETIIDGKEMEKRIQSVIPQLPWLVYEEEGQVIGYAYANQWKARSAYRHSVESTVYLKNGETAKGVGSALYKELLKILTDTEVHSIIGGISIPNASSVHLHEKFGYEKVAHFKEVGYKFGKWIDVGYWELIIE